MRANECLVPVDPVTQTRKMKKLATDIRQAPALSRPGRDTSVYPLTLLIMNVPDLPTSLSLVSLSSVDNVRMILYQQGVRLISQLGNEPALFERHRE